ncbi:MAG: DUF6782 family putative metallopeptidase [Alphaproteobacteria bacterium]
MPRPPPGYFGDKNGTTKPGTSLWPEISWVAPLEMRDDPKVRLERIRANMSLLPEGRELLKFADDNNIRIDIEDPKALDGNMGTARRKRSASDTHYVLLNKTYSDVKLTVTALHELRHTQQFEFFEKNRVRQPGTMEDARALAFHTRLIEGDAFTFETLMALKLKKMGRPEFFDQMKDPETATIKQYLAKHPPESFKNEQELARGLFTHIQLNGLKTYDANYFSDLRDMMAARSKVEDAFPFKFAHRPSTEIPMTEIGNADIGKLYGAELLSGSSLKALRVGIMQHYSPFDRETIKLAERLTVEAENLTQVEYAQKSSYIQARIDARHMPKEQRDVTLMEKFGAAAHKYAGMQQTPVTENAPRGSLLRKEPLMLETQGADSKFVFAEPADIKTKPGFKAGGLVAGVVMATTAGIAAAAEPGATPVQITDAAINTAVPGWTAARKGDLCAAFGEAVGVTVSGAAMVATTVVVAPAAVTATLASGPAAPVVGPAAAVGATAVVGTVGTATYNAVAPGAEQLCKTAVSAKNFLLKI